MLEDSQSQNRTGKASFRFVPKNAPQAAALEDQSLALLMDGPWGSGKTHVLAAKALLLGLLYPRNCIAFVRKKRVDLTDTLWKKFIEECLAHIPQKMIVASNDTRLYRKLSNGTEFFGLGLDSSGDVNKLASREYGFIAVEEATELTEEDFDKKIIRCLRLPGMVFLQVMLVCNPGSPSHWLYRRFIESPYPGYNRIPAEMLDNLPASYYEHLSLLKGVLHDRYVKGLWVSSEGLVYPFNPRHHIIERFPIPAEWRRVNSVDFGFEHPFVAHFWAISPEDIWYLDREIYFTHRIVSRHAQDMWRICLSNGIHPTFICDHDAGDRATLESQKLSTKAAKKERLQGQQTVYEKFENDRIFFFKDALYEQDQRLLMEERPYRTVMELPLYTWLNSLVKEDMIKEFDDGMDAMRYAMHTGVVAITADMLDSARRHHEREGEAYKQAYERMDQRLRQLTGLPPEDVAVQKFLREMFDKEGRT